MEPFDSLEKADSNGTSKHAYLCYFKVVRAKKLKKTQNGHFFEIEKKPKKTLNFYIFYIKIVFYKQNYVFWLIFKLFGSIFPEIYQYFKKWTYFSSLYFIALHFTNNLKMSDFIIYIKPGPNNLNFTKNTLLQTNFFLVAANAFIILLFFLLDPRFFGPIDLKKAQICMFRDTIRISFF